MYPCVKWLFCIVLGILCFESGKCVKNASPDDDALKEASYYWPFDNLTSNGGNQVREIKKKKFHKVYNGGKLLDVPQLGKALHLNNGSTGQWVEMKKMADPCIWRAECTQGISVGFWMHFISGDNILAAGGFTGFDSMTGFRIERDAATQYHALEVASKNKLWKIYISPIPKKWVYISFTFHEKVGLKLYLDGELTFETNKVTDLSNNKRNELGSKDGEMVIGRTAKKGTSKRGNYANFKIAHLAVWKKVITAKAMRKAYANNVKISPVMVVNCYNVREKFVRKPCERSVLQWDRNPYICPGITSKQRLCEKKKDEYFTDCKDSLSYCEKLQENQNICGVRDPRYWEVCKNTCGRCTGKSVSQMLMGRRKEHFTPQTLIFALLGCVGGLVVLLGATVYFWKVYRTRYQGAFIPTIKNVSLLDVSDYEDEKWPQKYIDSASYYIKDVPPKKNPLPVIPAKVKQNTNMYRYQPPEFD